MFGGMMRGAHQGTLPTATPFDPSQKGANIALSNADKTATMGTTDWQTIKTLTGRSSGKWYFEFTIVSSGSTVFGGLATAAASVSTYLGNSANSCGFNGGNLFNNGFTAGATGGVSNAQGSTNAFAVDMDAKKMWVLVNNAAIGGGDPVAGTSAFLTWAAAYTLYGAVTLGTSGNVATSTNTYAPPTGYSIWG